MRVWGYPAILRVISPILQYIVLGVHIKENIMFWLVQQKWDRVQLFGHFRTREEAVVRAKQLLGTMRWLDLVDTTVGGVVEIWT